MINEHTDSTIMAISSPNNTTTVSVVTVTSVDVNSPFVDKVVISCVVSIVVVVFTVPVVIKVGSVLVVVEMVMSKHFDSKSISQASLSHDTSNSSLL